jgi:hypothetical protein
MGVAPGIHISAPGAKKIKANKTSTCASDRKFNIKDITNQHNMDLTIDINKYGFLLVRGSDGDKCLIYGSSNYDNTNRVKDLIKFLSKNDVEIC